MHTAPSMGPAIARAIRCAWLRTSVSSDRKPLRSFWVVIFGPESAGESVSDPNILRDAYTGSYPGKIPVGLCDSIDRLLRRQGQRRVIRITLRGATVKRRLVRSIQVRVLCETFG